MQGFGFAKYSGPYYIRGTQTKITFFKTLHTEKDEGFSDCVVMFPKPRGRERLYVGTSWAHVSAGELSPLLQDFRIRHGTLGSRV